MDIPPEWLSEEGSSSEEEEARQTPLHLPPVSSKVIQALLHFPVDAADDHRIALLERMFPHPSAQIPTGGRLSHFWKNWAQLTTNPLILDTVQHGYRLESTDMTPLHSRTQRKGWRSAPPASDEDRQFLKLERDKWLKNHAIVRTPHLDSHSFAKEEEWKE